MDEIDDMVDKMSKDGYVPVDVPTSYSMWTFDGQ